MSRGIFRFLLQTEVIWEIAHTSAKMEIKTPESVTDTARAKLRICLRSRTRPAMNELTATAVGTMGRYGLKPIIFVLNNEGYMVERALEADPNWIYNDLAPWNYHALPAALGCQGWFTAKVSTLGELDAALERASKSDSACYIEVVGGRTDYPAGLAAAHGRLEALYAN